MESLFEAIKSANKMGIYLLVNKPKKRCYISYSSNMAQALVRLSSNFQDEQFDFELLEIVTNPINLKPRCQYFKNLYSSNGYDIINPKRVSNLKARIGSINDFRSIMREDILLTVELVSRGYRDLIVGVFSTITEINSFMSQNYSNGVFNIVYSNNKLTQEYLEYINGK